MTDELSRDEVSEILEAIYKENFEMPELRDRIVKIPKILDKYEGKWDGMLESAYKKFGKPTSLFPDSDSEAEEEAEEEAESFSVLKAEILSEPESHESWIKLANHFEKIGLKGRAEECKNRAKELS